MTDDITLRHAQGHSGGVTNKVLLEHMQGMKYELQQQIAGLGKRIDGLDMRISGLDLTVKNLAGEMHQGFEEARLHRTALQEDLEETMRVQSKHAVKLARV